MIPCWARDSGSKLINGFPALPYQSIRRPDRRIASQNWVKVRELHKLPMRMPRGGEFGRNSSSGGTKWTGSATGGTNQNRRWYFSSYAAQRAGEMAKQTFDLSISFRIRISGIPRTWMF